jgi:O-antigen ligase
MSARGRALAEIGLLAYLLLIPAGLALPAWPRDAALVTILAGVLAATVFGGADPGFRFLLPLALFVGSTALSIFLSARPEQSLARATYAPVAWLVFVAVQTVAVTPAAYRRLLVGLGAVVVIVGADGVGQLLGGRSLIAGSPPFEGRLTASLPHPNDLALIVMLFPVVLAGLSATRRTWPSRLVLVALPLALVTVIGSGSRNAWLGLGVGLAIVGAGALGGAGGAQRRWIVAMTGLALVLFAVAIGLSLGVVADRAARLLDPAREPRLVLWMVALRMFRESPLVGMGLHTFGDFHRPLVDTMALPSTAIRDADAVPWAHDLYLEVLAERGLVGALGFAAPVIAMITGLRRHLRAETGVAHPIALGLAASLATFLVLGLFDLTFLKDWVLLVFWLLAALVARLPCSAPARQPD